MTPTKIKLKLNRNKNVVIAFDCWEELFDKYGKSYIFEGTLKKSGTGYDVKEADEFHCFASLRGLESGTGIFEIYNGDTQLELDFSEGN